MKGYFSSLAKQSGVQIRAGKAPARPNPAPEVRPTGPVAPLESETVHFVDSEPAAVAQPVRQPDRHSPQDSDRQPTETSGYRAVPEHPRAPAENLSQSESVTTSFAVPAVSNAPQETVTNNAVNIGPERLETSLPSENSLASLVLEPPAEPVPTGHDQTGAVLEDRSPKKGVVRLRDENKIEIKTGPQTDSVGEKGRDLTPAASSIPHDYLEGIREWLTAPPVDRGESESRSRSEKAFTAVKEDHQPKRPHLVETGSPQNEIQELSLSIGSISIVVEEAAQPKQPAPMTQPQTNATASPAPQAHDAFALTRRYFRGF